MSALHIVLDPPTTNNLVEPSTNAMLSGHRSRSYLPGQAITGKVVLVLAKDDEIPSVSVRFRGKLKVVLPEGENGTRKYRYTFFSFEKILFKGGVFKMRATRYEWPFGFTIPKNYTPLHTNEFDPDGRFDVTGPQELPPLFDDYDGLRKRGVVTYKLYAYIPRTFAGWSATAMINIVPARMEVVPDPHNIIMGSRKFTPKEKCRYRYNEDYTPRPLTKREALADTFRGRSETQQVDFNFAVSAPTNIIIGRSYPISVQLLTAPTEMVIPDFHLTEIEVRVNSITEARTPGTFGDHERTFGDTFTLSARGRMSRVLEASEWVEVRDIFPEGEGKWKHIVPSFTSMAIQRWYSMEIRLKVNCLGKDFKITNLWPRVTFLPARMEDGVEEAFQMIANGGTSVVAPDGEVVPDYEPELAESSEAGASGGLVPLNHEPAPPPSYKESQK